MLTACLPGEGRASLSVTAWKAAERVVASYFVFQSKYDPSPFSFLLSRADPACSRGGCWRTSLSVNAWKAAGRVVARLFGEGSTSMSLPMDFCDCANDSVPSILHLFFFFFSSFFHHIFSQCEGYGEERMKMSTYKWSVRTPSVSSTL